MNIRVKSLMIALAMVTTVWGQEEPKLTVKPSGRILFDAAYINPQHQENQLKSGVCSTTTLRCRTTVRASMAATSTTGRSATTITSINT